MKKLFTSLFALCAFALGGQAQTGWNDYKVTGLGGTGNYAMGADTMYVGIQCRNGKYQAMCSRASGELTAMGLPTAYNAGDSVTWKIVKGAALGTTPRVRFINVRTGEYLYQGTKGGTSVVAYTGPFTDVFGGVKDFELQNQGTDGKASFYYYIKDGSNNFKNDATDAININTTNQGWKFIPKQGPQPKAALVTPQMGLGTAESVYSAGGSVTLKASVKKVSTDLMGLALLYHGATLLDTLALDANGDASYMYSGLIYGTEKFTVVYTGDINYGAQDSTLTLTVGPSESALHTKVELSIPATSESNKDVVMNIVAKTTSDDIVTQGNVVVYINNVAKNRIAVDALGLASITFPNFIAGTYNIKAFYVGDKMSYHDSDTARTSIDITSATSAVKPYPVYFDLAAQPEIDLWNRTYTTASTPRGYKHLFPKDSIAGIILQDTLAKITYNALATSYAGADTRDSYNHADNIVFPLGSGRSNWFTIKTPWLNDGSYNVYMSYRVSGDPKINMTSITIDGKELYFPNEELSGRWLRSWAGVNIRRNWNAKGYNANLGMNYLGSVKLEKSDIHDLTINVANENGYDITFDMLEFIPVEMDSVNANGFLDLSKSYYPMFDYCGFARMAGEAAVQAFADNTELAIPYQVADQTEYQKSSHTINNLGVTIVNELTANYVVVYRKDKWTRVAEGSIDGGTHSFTCDLPDGSYYYQELNYIDLGTVGAAGIRTFISDGSFTVGNVQGVTAPSVSAIKVFATGKTLNVQGIEAGAKVIITDITGKVVVNTTASADVFAKTLAPSIYIVKVVSAKGAQVAKVIVK